MQVRLKKTELLQKLEENRSAHRAIFDEAVEGYRKTVIEHLEGHIAAIKKGKVVRVVVNLPMPEDHTKDYNRVIAMFTMDQHDYADLEEQEFAQYVLDEWDWKRQFLTSNAGYSNIANGMLARMSQ